MKRVMIAITPVTAAEATGSERTGMDTSSVSVKIAVPSTTNIPPIRAETVTGPLCLLPRRPTGR